MRAGISLAQSVQQHEGERQAVGVDASFLRAHRMAMSLAVAALGAKGESQIMGTEVVKKSFPSFFDQMRKVGAKIE